MGSIWILFWLWILQDDSFTLLPRRILKWCIHPNSLVFDLRDKQSFLIPKHVYKHLQGRQKPFGTASMQQSLNKARLSSHVCAFILILQQQSLGIATCVFMLHYNSTETRGGSIMHTHTALLLLHPCNVNITTKDLWYLKWRWDITGE